MNPALAIIAAVTVLVNCAPLCASEADRRVESAFTQLYTYKTFLKDDAIKTESKDGVVTLSGEVAEASHKYLAQEAAAGIPGVQKVDNQLKVNLEGTEESDSWVRAKVRSVLALHRTVSGCNTQVDIRDGVITLRGVARSEAQRALAGEYAEDVKGVLRVTNVMTVTPTPSRTEETVSQAIDDASISAQVKVALFSHRSTSSLSTKVETTNGAVTISGTARNFAEKTLVTRLATDITGVKSVVNTMTFAPRLSDGGPRPARVQNLKLVSSTD